MPRLKKIFRPFFEIYNGIKTKRLPYFECGIWALFLEILMLLKFDIYLLSKLNLMFLYPINSPAIFWIGKFIFLFSGFLFWGIFESIKLNRLLQTLARIFAEAQLVTSLGRMPRFISDWSIDKGVREMTLAMNGIPLSSFKQAKEKLETEVYGYIEEIKENRIKGTIKIRYADSDIPKLIALESPKECKKDEFIIGNTRTETKKTTLELTPHLLIAGTSNSGKSTYLKQFVTGLYLNNNAHEFTLIDLKNGLESLQFQNLPRFEIIIQPNAAVSKLSQIQSLIQKRAQFLVENNCHKIEEFFKLKPELKKWNTFFRSSKDLGRHIIIIDEAAELFLTGAELSSDNASRARRIVSQIAAQGRAVGFHIIVSTQRPDVKVIDGTIKTNLQGRLCFHMPDNASSMTILDSVRAADLPDIKGRAIWRDGSELVEVQVPILSDDRIEELLSPLRIVKENIQEVKNSPTDEEKKEGWG